MRQKELEQMREIYDEAYEDAYQDTYRDAYDDAIAGGDDHDEAQCAASIDAEHAATNVAQNAVEAAGGDESLLSPEGV